MSERRRHSRSHRLIGVVEPVQLIGRHGILRILARIDTGASRTSLDTKLAEHLGFGPVLRRVRIRAAAATEPETRDVVMAQMRIAGRAFEVPATITDRTDMRYRMIVGMDVLGTSGFLVDPSRASARSRRRKATR